MQEQHSRSSGYLERRFLSAMLVACGFGLAACGGGGSGGSAAPRFVVATHGTAGFSNGGDSCPYNIDFSIFLEEGGKGWVSMETPEIGSNLVEVSWEEAAGTITVTSPKVRVYGLFVDDPYYTAEIGWSGLSLQARDDDRDGTAEAGDASIRLFCQEYSFYGGTFHQNVDLPLQPAAQAATLRIEDRDESLPFHPFFDAIKVRSSRPILRDSIADAALLGDATAIPGTVTALNPEGPLADGFVIDPSGPVPFATSLGVDPASTTDALDAPVEFDGNVVETVSDPGPITDNPSFEGSGGWINAHITSSSFTFPAVDGSRIAYIGNTQKDMVGYLDVPQDASSLSFEEAVYGDLYDCPGAPGIWVEASASLPVNVEDVEPVACDDCQMGRNIPWHKVTYDVSGVRGQRVVIRAYGASYTECAPDLYPELDLDDFRIQ